MANPLFNMLGGNSNPFGNSPLGNVTNLISQFQQFKSSYQGTPLQAQQQVQQMLNSGRVSQSQFNQISNTAKRLMEIMGSMR